MPLILLTAAQHSRFFSDFFFFFKHPSTLQCPTHPIFEAENTGLSVQEWREMSSRWQFTLSSYSALCSGFWGPGLGVGVGGWRMVHVSSGGCTHAWLGHTYVGESADPLSQHPHMEQQEVRLKFIELRCRGRRARCRSLMQRGNWTKWTSDSEPEGLSDLFSHT